ncbi:STAS domain-containing protein [Erythrobacter sp. NAP1]|uniref:STAS domain-containing protein n=1 Tax=Erythrobacter sp. NAP1 TaxID=237727 RepID=UPI00032562EE|nr:STAS domain-containing protein [Erythrobacter sp. NAP1]
MQNIAAISPVLGAYDASHTRRRAAFGNPVKPRYATRMTGAELDWKTEERGSALIIAPSGRVDESTADNFKTNLIEHVKAAPANAVIDLAGIDYMSSRGLRALTLAQRAGQETDTTIVLARPNETMREILAISRYDMVFRVADTIEDAIGH